MENIKVKSKFGEFCEFKTDERGYNSLCNAWNSKLDDHFKKASINIGTYLKKKYPIAYDNVEMISHKLLFYTQDGVDMTHHFFEIRDRCLTHGKVYFYTVNHEIYYEMDKDSYTKFLKENEYEMTLQEIVRRIIPGDFRLYVII